MRVERSENVDDLHLIYYTLTKEEQPLISADAIASGFKRREEETHCCKIINGESKDDNILKIITEQIKRRCCQPAARRLLLCSGKTLINQSSALWGTDQWPLCSTGWRSHICQP